ncbi:uncharacterized protein EDB93DRAFT_1250478 [Suillus bovinus]|uniref:uncharacterized protein n=1 Tax=Suillus bovinus TaxID=48563 RepID=UPI001B869254|nr:uncharacterized protein EDB93DRAFT_1250478 [Suillus bovinus]KAG2147768.1 hypothetical protein EDB93DRAFT_1250478 [Suillus bovinus]
MSTPVNTSLTSLKEITAKIMAIITGARQLPLGHSHFSLTTQADAVRQYGSGPYLLGLMCSCSRELIRVWGMTPQVWPNWHSISKVLAWEELGDHTFNLPVVSGPSVCLIPVDLSPSPVIAGPSTNPASKSREKGKGKAVAPDPEPELEGTQKRKSPMIPALPSQPLKSTMKTRKWVKTTGRAKFKVFVESEDEEDSVTQPISHGVPEVVLPQLSPDVARTSGSPRSSWSPKKKPFGPAMAIAGKCLEVIEPPQATPEPPVEAPPVINACDILIPRPIKQPLPGLPQDGMALRNSKIKCISVSMGTLPKLVRGQSITQTTRRTRSRTPSKAPSKALAASQTTSRTRSQSQVSSVTPGPSGAQTPKAQTRGHSKTVTAAKEPTPAPASVPSSTSGVPCLALDVPMPDLHAMAMAIREGAARIAALEEHVVEQDAKIDTLQCLHEGLRREIILWHPKFPLPDAQGDVTSFLLHQPVLPAMSTPASALPPLIDLSMEGMEPNPPNLQDESAINGLIFELNQIHPEVSQMPSEIVKPDDPGNLFPEYDSVEEMDVQVKGEPSGEDVDMTT